MPRILFAPGSGAQQPAELLRTGNMLVLRNAKPALFTHPSCRCPPWCGSISQRGRPTNYSRFIVAGDDQTTPRAAWGQYRSWRLSKTAGWSHRRAGT